MMPIIVPLSTQVYRWVPTNLMLRITLQWASIPSRGSRNTRASREIFQVYNHYYITIVGIQAPYLSFPPPPPRDPPTPVQCCLQTLKAPIRKEFRQIVLSNIEWGKVGVCGSATSDSGCGKAAKRSRFFARASSSTLNFWRRSRASSLAAFLPEWRWT